MDFLAAEATNLFIGTEDAPRQVVRLRLVGSASLDGRGPARVRIEGDSLRTEETLVIGPLGKGQEVAARGRRRRRRRRGRRTGHAGRGRDRGRRRVGPAPGRAPRRGAGLADVHDLPLPLRPGLVEHAGRLYRVVGQRDPVPPAIPGAGPRPRQGASRDGPSRRGLQVRSRRARLPQALLGRLSGGPCLRPASSWPRAGSSSWAARTTSRTRT